MTQTCISQLYTIPLTEGLGEMLDGLFSVLFDLIFRPTFSKGNFFHIIVSNVAQAYYEGNDASCGSDLLMYGGQMCDSQRLQIPNFLGASSCLVNLNRSELGGNTTPPQGHIYGVLARKKRGRQASYLYGVTYSFRAREPLLHTIRCKTSSPPYSFLHLYLLYTLDPLGYEDVDR